MLWQITNRWIKTLLLFSLVVFRNLNRGVTQPYYFGRLPVDAVEGRADAKQR